MANVLTDSELDYALRRLMELHQGRENAIERWELVRRLFGEGSDLPRDDGNVQDRQVRAAVQRLRHGGMMILDMNDGRGRFVAQSAEEYHEFRTKYLQPLRSRAELIRAMDRHAKEKWPNLLQPSLFDMDALRAESWI